MKALRDLLASLGPASTIAVCGHTRPDGDAMGSVLGLSLALRDAGLDVLPLLADASPTPPAYSWMPCADALIPVSSLDAERRFDLLIIVDTPVIERLGQAGQLLARCDRTFLIDHHPARGSYTDQSLCDPGAAATGLLLWEILPELKLQRTPAVATCCYTALLSDTGSFRFSNTDARALEGASSMVAAGADPALIATALFANKPLAALRLDELVLSRAQLENAGAVVVSHYDQGDLSRLGVDVGWTEDLIDLIRVVEGAGIALLFVGTDAGARVSLRSSGSFDVSEVAMRFGGGGHHAAAGITWPDKEASIPEIRDRLLALLPQGAQK
ncbi:MAG: bifunctional oligoribonuclease/PAP phosphatase NrnA [Actinomycetia bacterium]|nr:bifunctional oligoribonuclease/PAP phosphatase NrnA [Actinomycetes bacterium]